MSDLSCYLMILGSIAAVPLLLKLMDLYFAEEIAARKAQEREALREVKRRENAAWYIATRTEDNRADLIRAWEEVEL